MASPHRPDAPELPDFSMLKRLARDQLIYLLEQVSAHARAPGPGRGWLGVLAPKRALSKENQGQ
jgi:hypothetical protein